MSAITGPVMDFRFCCGESVADSGEDVQETGTGPRSLRALLVIESDAEWHAFAQAADASSLHVFNMVRAASKDAARRLIREDNFDIVFLDLWIGNRTTLPLLDFLAERENGCPVVILSNLHRDDIMQVGVSGSTTAFLAKSEISAATLDQVARELLPDVSDTPALPLAHLAAPVQIGDLKALVRALDAVHANALVAGVSLADGRIEDAGMRLKETVATASSLRQAILDLVIGTGNALAATPQDDLPDSLYGIAAFAAECTAHEAQTRRVTFDIGPPSGHGMTLAVPDVCAQMVQDLIATIIWKAATGSTINVAVTEGTQASISLDYMSDKIVRLDGSDLSEDRLNAVLANLDEQARKYGGRLTVTPIAGRTVVTLLLGRAAGWSRTLGNA